MYENTLPGLYLKALLMYVGTNSQIKEKLVVCQGYATKPILQLPKHHLCMYENSLLLKSTGCYNKKSERVKGFSPHTINNYIHDILLDKVYNWVQEFLQDTVLR